MKSRILNQILTASVSLILITSSRTTPPSNFSCPQKSQRYQLVWQTSGGPPQILIIPYGYKDTQRIASTWATTRTTPLTTIAIGRGQQEQDNRNIYQGLLNDSVDIFQYNGLIRKEFVLFTSLHLRLTPSIVPFSPLLFWKPTISQTRQCMDWHCTDHVIQLLHGLWFDHNTTRTRCQLPTPLIPSLYQVQHPFGMMPTRLAWSLLMVLQSMVNKSQNLTLFLLHATSVLPVPL